MAIELEGLEFQIEAKAEDGTKGIESLTKNLRKLRTALSKGWGENSSVKQIEGLSKALQGFQPDKVKSMCDSLQSLKECKISSTLPKQISAIGNSLKDITLMDVERVEDLGKALRELQDIGNVRIPKVSVPNNIVPTTTPGASPTTPATPTNSPVEQTESKMQVATGAAHRFSAALKEVNAVLGITYPFKQLGTALTAASTKMRQAMGSLKEMYASFKQGGGIVGAFGRAVSNMAKNSASRLAAFVKNVTSAIGKGLNPTLKKSTGRLGQFFNSIKRIALYRAIRFMLSELTKAFKEGVNNLYQYSNVMGGQFATSMNSLATNALYLKNSIGAMAAPIINALAPAIDFVIGKIATLLNYINMLFARLSGASVFTAAKKSATSYGDALSSAGGSASDAAKEIKNATTGIDELNMIMANDSSGGGGGGGTDYGSMFEELPIDSNVTDFADRLKEAFDNADWKSLGTILGDKVNEIIDSIDWYGAGSKLGFGLNGAIQTAYYFLDAVNFNNIGARIAEFFNGAIANVDWNVQGRLVSKILTGTWLIDGIIGAIQTVDWKLVGQSIGEFFIGAFDEFTEWVNKYDWGALGTELWQKFKDLVTNIDWASVAKSLFKALGSAMGAAVSFIGSFFGSVWEDIKSYFTEKIEECGGDIPAGLWKGIKDAFGNAVTWINENIVQPFIEGFKELFGIHSPSTVMEEIGVFIMEGLLGGILKPFKAIGTWIKTNIVDPLTEAFEDFDLVEFTVGVKNTASEWWSNVNSWWDRQVGKVQNFTTNVTNNATTWWNNTKTWWSGKVGKVKEFTTFVTNQATSWWSKVNTWWDGKVGKVKEFTTAVTNQASTWWSNVKTWWSGKVGAVENFTTNVANQSATWWNNTKTWWSGKVGAVKEFTTTVTNQSSVWWSNVKTWWSGKVGAVQQFTTSVKNEATTWWSNVKTWWSGKVGAVQQFTTSVKNEATTWWSNTKSYWSGKVGAVQSFTTNVVNQASTWWSNVKTWWNNSKGSLSASVSITNAASTWWSNVKTWWNNACGTLWATLGIKVPKVSVEWSTVTVFGKDYSYPSGFNLTWNAKGGILDGAQIFGMLGNSFLGGGEAGKEAVLPLERHTEWMDTLADKVRNGLPEDNGVDSIGYSTFRRALDDFYNDRVESTVNQMASDMNRQANKKEQTTVQVGNRVITDAVTTQQNANGYRFTTA